jgi:hypothetical protein
MELFFITREDYNGQIMFFLEHVNYSTKFSCIQVYFMSKVVAEATLEALEEEDSESLFVMRPMEELVNFKEFFVT